jgi:hypothetical protein
LVRSTLSFSKNLTNHIGAIKYFICHYNLTKCAALPEEHYLSERPFVSLRVTILMGQSFVVSFRLGAEVQLTCLPDICLLR